MLDAREDRRISVDRLIPLIDVKKALAISWPRLIELVRGGTLPVYDITGRTVNRKAIKEETRGLRVLKSDLIAYVDSIKVR